MTMRRRTFLGLLVAALGVRHTVALAQEPPPPEPPPPAPPPPLPAPEVETGPAEITALWLVGGPEHCARGAGTWPQAYDADAAARWWP